MSEIVIVGVGALGSNLVQLLRNEPVELTIVDDDRVEQKNVLSQFHSKTTVGRNKAKALAGQMSFLFGKKLKTVPHRLNKDNAEQILKNADLVIDCVDNIETRFLLSLNAIKFEYALLHGAVAADGAFGRVIWDEKFEPDEEDEGTPTCEDGEHLPFLMMTSAVLARSVQMFLKDDRKVSFHILPTGVMIV